MFSIETKPGLSAPVTIGRKGGEASGSVQSPKQQEQHLVDNERARHSTETETDRIPPAKRPESSYRAQVIASRSLSSGSSVSGSASSDTTDSSMATDATSRASEVPAEDEDEKSSGHTVAEQRQSSSERVSTLQLAGAETRHSDSTRPTPSTLTASPTSGCETSSPTAPRYHSHLPVVASQQPVQRQQARSKPTRRSSLATTSTSGQAVNSDYSRPRAAAGGDAGSSSSRSYSTSPRQGLSRSYTTGAVSSMGAGLYSANGNTSPPPQFPVTSSVAPPVQNSASVTFAPAPTRARAYSTSASGLASPTSPAIESMAAINIDAMRRSPPSTTSPAASPPSAPLSSHHALVNATTSSPPSSTAWNSTPTAGHVAGSASSADLVSSGNKIGSQVSPPLVPSNNTSAANRRHSVDPYSMRNTTSIYNHNVTMHQTPVTGHRRHHQSIHVPPSSSEYSCLNEYQHQSNQAHHLMQLGSRYRKASLGSQALLSPSTVDKLSSPPPGSFLSSIQSGSSSRQQPWERGNSYSHGESSSGTQISPTRSRTDPYLSTSPRYSSRASHEAQRNNQLEAKIVLLGRQGVGKTSLVHRYITGKFSSTLPMTIGASFLVKKLDFEGGIKVRLQIWDTAGQERFRSMAPMYYRGAHAAILVYDITNDESLSDIQVWLDELRQNMSSDLIVHIVGNKADLATSSRKITLEDAKKQISDWIARPSSGIDSSTLSIPQPRRSTSGGGGHTTTSKSADEGSPSNSRQGMVGLASFNLSRSASRQKASEESEPALPAFKDWGLEEVSAKEDDGIDMLFATIAGKLVERKNQIEQERVLRTKDSIMITDEMKGKNEDTTRIWGCC